MRLIRVFAAAAAATSCAFTLTACDLHNLGIQQHRAERPAARSSAAAATPSAARPMVRMAPVPRIVLRTRTSRTFGTLVVNARGRTLYRSDADTVHPSRSHCTGACLKVWHPAWVPAGGFRAVGIDGALVATIAGPHGARQLTLAGWPLYTFAGDTEAGQVNGQCGRGFFAITPAGKRNAM